MQKHRQLLLLMMGTSASVVLFFLVSCQPPKNTDTNANGNTNANINVNASPSTNINASSDTGSINTREPDKYAATLIFSIETQGGDKAIGIPPLSIQVARSGED